MSIYAQFTGGPDDGMASQTISNASLGRNIYKGGSDDGHAFMLASGQAMGRNIFLGGIDDGHTLAIAASQPLGRNIYLGGIDDGHSMALVSSASLGRNIFLGGIGDGNDVSAASSQPFGRNIYTGGVDDGWAMAQGTGIQVIPLPVVLFSFNGRWDENHALLDWKTASESNTARFELERSFDGSVFAAIGSRTAAGQSSSLLSYTYTDSLIRLHLPLQTVYYRLRTVDIDGKFSYSGIVILKTEQNRTIQYTLFPNPARDRITVGASALTGKTTILIRDASGKLVSRQDMNNLKESVPVYGLAAGVYFVELVSDNRSLYTQKLIISK